MQTFLPYEDFEDSAACLDRMRLGKQRVENLQIMKALLTGKGWIHHPATKMWDGYLPALMVYHKHICWEWLDRGYKDTCMEKAGALYYEHGVDVDSLDMPPFIGVSMFHDSHKASLMRKDPEHYSFDVDPSLEYWWPTKEMPEYA